MRFCYPLTSNVKFGVTQETKNTFSHNTPCSLVQDEANPLESLMAPSLGLKSIFNMLTTAVSWSVKLPDVILYYVGRNSIKLPFSNNKIIKI